MAENKKNFSEGRRKSPFIVPDEYFNSVADRVMMQLPELPVDNSPAQPRPIWKRVVPYLSLAAMFVGIWCMMKVFHMVSQPSYSLDNIPEQVALALNDPDTYEYYSMDFINDDRQVSFSDADFDEESASDFQDYEDISDQLGIILKPEYENIVIEEE